MAVDFYFGRTAAELLVLLRAAQDRKARGNLTEVSAAGVRTVRDFSKNQSVEAEIFNIRKALWRLDPDSYPDPALERITRTRAYYRDNSPGVTL